MPMPPANTPSDASLQDNENPTSLTSPSLSYLSSPAPDLAATLVTQTEDNVEQDNIRFLRMPFEDSNSSLLEMSSPRESSPSQRFMTNQRHTERQRASRMAASELFRRVDDPQSFQQDSASQEYLRLDREHEAWLQSRSERERQREGQDAQSEMDLYRVSMERPSDVGDTPGRAPRSPRTQVETQQRSMDTNPRRNESLRSTAIMQHARMINTTDRMLRYIRDREYGGQPEQTTSHEQGDDTAHEQSDHDTFIESFPGQQPSSEVASQSPSQQNTLPRGYASTLQWRREFLAAHPPNRATYPIKPSSAKVSEDLESAIMYLETIRRCQTTDEALSIAMLFGLTDHAFRPLNFYKLTTDIDQIPLPTTCSWLQSGVKYTGSQHTNMPPEPDRSTYRPIGYPNNVTWESSQPFDATRPWLSHNTSRIADIRSGLYSGVQSMVHQPLQHWPVKVAIHAVDQDSMTLTGTMEAYDVPSHGNPSSTTRQVARDSPITTYLEGQIIDHRIHSLRTPCEEKRNHHRSSQRHRTLPPITNTTSVDKTRISFPTTTPAIDAANWRRLPPFSKYDDDEEVARMLLSPDHLAAISQSYILMRWKERCFIHSSCSDCPNSPRRRSGTNTSNHTGEGDDTDTGHGLTICGFYYVSLCRQTGEIQGLYFDPATSPYQCLKLEARRNTVGAGQWEFR